MQARLEVAVSIPEELADLKPNQARLVVVALIQDDKLEERVVRIIYNFFFLLQLMKISARSQNQMLTMWNAVLITCPARISSVKSRPVN